MRTEDGHIIHKCLNGEPEAFGFIVDKYKESVYAFAYTKLRNFQDAEDVTQEVFIKAYRKLNTLRSWDNLLAWLYAITSNLCKDWIRARSRRPDQEFIEDKDPNTLEAVSVNSYRESLILELLDEALDSLPEIYQQVLVLHYMGNMNSFEIAKFIGMSPGSVRERLSRARALLKEEILTMMNVTFEGQRLRAGFTFRIVETVKHIRIHPGPPVASVPWILSLAAGVIFGVLSLGPGIKLPDLMPAPMSSPIPEKSSVIMNGEFPLKLLMGDEMLILSGKQGYGSGGESNRLVRQNAFSLAPKGEKYTFVASWPEEIIGLRSPSDVKLDSSGNLLVADSANHRIQKFDLDGNILKAWGTYGSGDGQFDFPVSIAIDNSGNIYVSDSQNNRIQKFDSEGNFLTKWGTLGSGDGQLNYPNGIAVSDSGNIYVHDLRNYRIQKFNSEGKFLMKWGSEGSGDGQFKWGYNLVVDKTGNVYVADSGNYRIQKFDSNGNFLAKWGSQGEGDGQFQWAYGIAIDNSGNVIVSGTDCRFQKFTPDGRFLSKWGIFGYGDEQLFWPEGIVVDKEGNVYVADGMRSRIQKFDQNGNFLKNTGGTNAGGQLNQPCGLALDKTGNVYVVDQANTCIQKFDQNGKFLTKWGKGGFGIGQFSWPYGITVDKADNVYVADPNVNQRIHKFDSNGKFLKSFSGPFGDCSGVAVNSKGNIYVAERGVARIRVSDSNGAFVMDWGGQGAGDGQFYWCESLAVDADDNVYVADTGNNRIQVFDSKGRFLAKWGSEGTSDGQFSSPNGITVDSSGRVYVVDSGNYRIQVFDSNGNFLAKWGKYGAGDKEFAWPSYGIAVSKSGYVYVSDTSNNRIKVFRSPVGGSVDPLNKQPVTWGQVKQTELFQNYPNPFNPETWIPYQLDEDTRVEISIYTSDGQLVRTLNLGRKQAGSYTNREKSAYWDGKNEAGESVSSGIYFYTIHAGDYSDTKKMVIAE